MLQSAQRASHSRRTSVANGKSRNDRDHLEALTWAVKCRSCQRYSRYNEYYQKPRTHSSKGPSPTSAARCPKCGSQNEYRSADMELIAKELLSSSDD